MRTFKNAALGFCISYPDSWQSVPDPWMRQFLGRAKSTSEKLNEYIAKGSPPFLVAHDPSVPAGLAIPAVKCKAYTLSSVEAGGGIHALLGSLGRHFQQAFPDFEVREYVPEFVMAGVVGAKLVTAMSVQNPEGDSFHGITEMLFLPTKRYVFSIGLTATSDPAFRPESEFSEIKRSIRLS